MLTRYKDKFEAKGPHQIPYKKRFKLHLLVCGKDKYTVKPTSETINTCNNALMTIRRRKRTDYADMEFLETFPQELVREVFRCVLVCIFT